VGTGNEQFRERQALLRRRTAATERFHAVLCLQARRRT
jgi:hypothetical protein